MIMWPKTLALVTLALGAVACPGNPPELAKTEPAAMPDVLGTVKLLGLLDVDGDGRDEVFYEDAYHEGWYLMMMQWEGDAPQRRILTGDGI
jgi:hypothetical protein